MAAFTDEQAEARKRTKDEEAALRREKGERDEFVRAALTTPQGRTYFSWLLQQTGYPNVNPAASPPEAMAFRCGVLSVGQAIGAHLLEVAPEALPRLLVKDASDVRSGSDLHPVADAPSDSRPDAESDAESLTGTYD